MQQRKHDNKHFHEMVAIYINKHRKKEQTMNNEQPESTTKGYKDCERKDTCSLYASIKRQEKAATNKVKEKQPYFTNAQVGDEVVCIIYGKGVVKKIDKSYTFTAIAVEYPTSNSTSSPTKPHTKTYSLEGKYAVSANQTLFYVEDVIILIASTGVEPKRVYIPQVGDIVNIPKKEVGIVQNVFKHPTNGKTTLAVIVQSKHSFYKEKNQMGLTLFTQCEYLENASLIKRYNTVKEAFNSKEFDYNQ